MRALAIVIVAGVVVLHAVSGCGGEREPAGAEDRAAHDDRGHESGEHRDAEQHVLRVDREMLRDLRITTAAAESRAAGERVTVLGELAVNQDAYAEVASPVAARVTKVLAASGDLVEAGRALVELHSPELGKARAEAQAARARRDLARKALDRKRDLAAEKLVTVRELQEAEAAAATAGSDERVAVAALRAFGQAGDAAGDASRLTLRAPIRGTVIERSVVLGQLADPSHTLFRVGDLSHLWLTAHVFERDAVRLETGGKATIAFAALPGHPVDAVIASIGREVEASSRTIPVRLDVPNADGSLRPGMSATVALALGDRAISVVAVPLASVQRVGDRWVVFVPRKDEGAFDVRAVGRGRELGGEVEVLSGLAAREVVVVDGAFLLKAEADKARGEGGEHEH
ncbi:MAG TPA: efflux RND transporter periplasmic adaptor subunit [Kofleriaceae bacterium]|nr:efflux RND transporter periplasmic adaptor subunit [Kofleriaceae bacterium]